jgi:hypothetical protein
MNFISARGKSLENNFGGVSENDAIYNYFSCSFKNNQTWLQIAHREGQQFRQIGSQPFSCACRDKELYGCGRDGQTFMGNFPIK